ncbi:MAG TPA: GDCCVxC domain-containing (seleno)protein [Rudaea sp.]|nr:GDCCVxC domain-containing (seleno)protein [Rudaea sp.]
MNAPVVLTSTLTCPECGQQTTETMPVNACIWFHECARCKTMLRPMAGDCCVFCSYGSVPCPPVQQSRDCCRPTS